MKTYPSIPWDEIKAAEDDCLICGRKFPSIDQRDRIDLEDAFYAKTGHDIGVSLFIWAMYALIFGWVVVRLVLDQLAILSWDE